MPVDVASISAAATTTSEAYNGFGASLVFKSANYLYATPLVQARIRNSINDNSVSANGSSLAFDVTLTRGGSLYQAMELNYAGNLGLGVTPSDWTLGKVLQVGGVSAFWDYSNTTYLSNNRAYVSGNKYIANGYATTYEQSNGTHVWLNAPSGTAGNAISFTQAMTLSSTGNLLVGTTSDSGNSLIKEIILKSPSNGVARTLATTNSGVQAHFGVSEFSSANIGFIGTLTANPFQFLINDSEKARFDTSGNFLINTTTPSSYGNFTNNKATAVLSAGGSGGARAFSTTQVTTPTPNTTVDVWLPVDGNGSNYGTNVIVGHFYIYIRATAGADGFTGIYTIVTTGNGLTGATLSSVTSVVRGTNPVTSIQIANVSGGSVKLQVTYNGTFTTYGACTVVFNGAMY